MGAKAPWWTDLGGMIDRRDAAFPTWAGFYTWSTTNHPSKPIMLAEWGVESKTGDPNGKPAFFTAAPSKLAAYPKVKAYLYWDAPWGPGGDATRIDQSAASLTAFQQLAATPYLNQKRP
jgi:hypothetical protein